jgi:hypothetical protein
MAKTIPLASHEVRWFFEGKADQHASLNYPAASCGVSKPQNPKISAQCHRDGLAMQLLRRLFLPRLFDILADDFFLAVTADGADTGPCGPKFTCMVKKLMRSSGRSI